MTAGRTFTPGVRITRMRKTLADPSSALRQVGALLVAESQQAFVDQKFGGKRWPARAPVNVYGILADLDGGRTSIPKRRFQTRPALKDTGRLAASISFAITRRDTVTVGSNLPYAGVHQKGGPVESVKITGTIRRRLAEWLKKNPRHAIGLGWLLNRKFLGKRLKGEVPARPFVGLTPRLRRDIRDMVGAHVRLGRA